MNFKQVHLIDQQHQMSFNADRDGIQSVSGTLLTNPGGFALASTRMNAHSRSGSTVVSAASYLLVSSSTPPVSAVCWYLALWAGFRGSAERDRRDSQLTDTISGPVRLPDRNHSCH
jgi:hypothetical protein